MRISGEYQAERLQVLEEACVAGDAFPDGVLRELERVRSEELAAHLAGGGRIHESGSHWHRLWPDEVESLTPAARVDWEWMGLHLAARERGFGYCLQADS